MEIRFHCDGTTTNENGDRVIIKALTTEFLEKKEYQFDSLVFRYKEARLKQAQYDAQILKYEQNLSQLEAEIKAKRQADRDIMRFIEILRDAMEGLDGTYQKTGGWAKNSRSTI